jgi:hypothetical protein
MEIELRDAKTGRTAWSRLYTREEPVRGKEVQDVVRSLDQNLKQGLSEIVAGLHQYFADSAGPRSRGYPFLAGWCPWTGRIGLK